MEWLIALGVISVVLPGLYLYTVSVAHTSFPRLRNKRICLLIAHPDDEAMFFAPTVLALTRPETGNHVKILCLSSGNASGLGETRKKELAKSGLILGLRKPDDVFVVEKPYFPDSMTENWDASKISDLLCDAFAPHLASSRASTSNTTGPVATIDVLITFDASGISAHPNHISLYHGARAFIAALVHGKPGWTCPVDMYTLTTVSFLRKYTGIVDVFATLVTAAWDVRRRNMVDKKHPSNLVFMNGLGAGGIGTAWIAMTKAHKSQMVWFRYGWITLSRYMVMNDLRLEKVKST